MPNDIPNIEGLSLDNPHIDRKVNAGTTAPNCQPRHTRIAMSLHDDDDDDDDDNEDNDSSTTGDGSTTEYSSSSKKSNRSEKKSVKREKAAAAAAAAAAKKKRDSEDPKKMGYLQMAKMGYQELVNAIIRPPRADYKEETLGPPAFLFCGKRFTRTDFALKTKRGLNLQCSHWEPVERASDRIPVVIYMHGNSSARVEVLPQLSYLLSLGIAVFSFDFAGSGKSDGEYVTLGYYEREDLMCVVAHLRATNVVSTIALWGRSMGAATALMHGYRDPSIACMILDSPFTDLTTLAEEMVEKGRDQGITVPGFVVSIALRMIRGSVKKQAGVDIRHISPIAHADKCFIPALFVAGEHDDFINKRHSEQIHAKYAGDKNMIVVEGDHNSPRPKFMFDSVSIFLQTCLQIPNSWALNTHPGMNLMAPPWNFPGIASSRLKMSTSMGSGGAAGGGSGSRYRSVMDRHRPEEMGMTAERQREIQASLFKMLGQQDDDDDDNDDGDDKNSKKNKQ
eukprot:CAMPEP_0176496276 /NCGR_PEP_ID=MMETSP0200_2-20121128/11108_1 /TAXON_ID=947934 /ORGANISM="Chaetoceros sp., Strain GSL56" /LENGTH=506 /DNA_ID=CAMNT_0017894219 /DNA_START=23 /DNA_END=1546 /DNA_ORIENTATION=+